MKHTVKWSTQVKQAVARDLTQFAVRIERPDGVIVEEKFVPPGTTQADFELAPGDYVEKVAATNASGSMREGTIERPLVITNGGTGPVYFPFPVWADAPPPNGNGPDKAFWDSAMVEWGIVHGDALSSGQSVDWVLNHIYYDGPRVYYQIADYTEDAEPWNTYAKQAAVFYRDQYVVPNNGALPGYQAFARGLRLDYERTGDEASKAAAILISQNAMYFADWTEPASTEGMERSREVAYAILSYIDAEALGEAKRAVRALRVTDSYGYFAQWYDTATWENWQISPFMMGITCQALIADWEETQDARCLPALLELADWMWGEAYHEPTHAMLYQLNPDNTSEGGLSTQGAPDLNMIIAPLYGWLWAQTGDAVHRDRFDALLLGQANAYLAQGKQFDQNYWWAFDGMRWRESV